MPIDQFRDEMITICLHVPALKFMLSNSLRPALIGVIATGLTGCGILTHVVKKQDPILVAASDLDSGKIANLLSAKTPDDRLSAIGSVVDDSVSKCITFMNGLVLIENTTNTGFDMATTLFSALATAFTPLSTVHGLTAAATVSSGWKTAIDSDIYAKATVANYSQAIQASYFKQLSDYVSTLEKTPRDQVVAGLELTKIRSIHVECSLAAAQSAIAATITAATSASPSSAAAAPGAAATTSKLLKVVLKGAAKKGDQVTVTASATGAQPALAAAVTGTYVVKDGDTAASIAHGLYAELTSPAASALKNAGITAQLLPAPLDDSIVLTAPTASAIQWTVSKSNAEELSLFDWSGSLSAAPAATAVSIPGSSLIKNK
jgi:hypothetical protein